MRFPGALGAMMALMPMSAHAHPHVFVDATIEVIFDAEGQVSALRIGWEYDDLFSLAYLAENGYDADFDGTLNDEERQRLTGFDMEWDPDFPGDTYVLWGDQPILLGRPMDPTADYRDGRLRSTHLRPLERSIDPTLGEIVVQVYDPSFYTSYSIAADPVLTGRSDCKVQVFEPDRQAADQILQAALDELAGSADAEVEFPAIGAAYAEEARVSCTRP